MNFASGEIFGRGEGSPGSLRDSPAHRSDKASIHARADRAAAVRKLRGTKPEIRIPVYVETVLALAATQRNTEDGPVFIRKPNWKGVLQTQSDRQSKDMQQQFIEKNQVSSRGN